MKKLILFLLLPLLTLAQNPTNFPYGIKNAAATTDNTPAYFTTTQVDGVHKKTPAALVAKTATVNDSLATKENVANKSDSYTTSSSTTYASTKALVDGLGTKVNKVGETLVNSTDFDILVSQDQNDLTIKKRDLQPESIRLPVANTSIFAWGDSLTQGAGSSPWKPYPEVLSDLTLFSVTNNGVGGETSTQIKDRLVADTGNYSKSVIIWAGRNNFSDPTTVKADIATMVSTIGHDRYLILGVLNSSAEVKNGTSWTTITALNNDLKTLYGSKYVSIREYLVSLYNPSIPQDVTDHANDVPPSSLRSDFIHLNNKGYAKVAEYVNQRLGNLFNTSSYLQSKDFKYYFENNLPLHNIGDESFTGVKSTTNSGTTLVNGLSFINNGTGINSPSIFLDNRDSGRAIKINNRLTGTGINLDNQTTGIGIFVANNSTGRGFSYSNNNTGRGLMGINMSTGVGFFSDNLSSGTGISAQNGSSGVSIRVLNASTGIGYSSTNLSTGTLLLLDSSPDSTGDLIRFTKNTVLTSKFDQNGVLTLPSLILSATPTTSAGTYDILTRNTSTGVVEKITSASVAPLASPTFTGTPTAPTAAVGTNTTQIATTAFVQAVDAGNVKTTGAQTIAGLKEFTDGININSTVNELFQINKSGVKYAHMIVDNVNNIKGFGLFGSYLALENTSLNIDPQLRIANSPENAFATIQAYSSTNPLTKHSLYLLASGEVYVRANNNDRVTLEGGSFYFKTGNLLVNTNIDNGVDKLQVNGTASFSSSVTAASFNGGATLTGTPTAPTATVGTNTTQIATTAFVLANARPYKVYTALLSQSDTSAPTATVLENTLSGTIVWTRNSTGQYFGTLSTAFVSDKTFCLTGGNTNNGDIHSTTQRNSDNEIIVQSYSSGAKTDGLLNKTAIEIRVYN